jgi:hypothetical protein
MANLGISSRLWLEGAEAPYNLAITLLRKLPGIPSPTTKIECLLDINNALCYCVRDFYKDKNANQRDMVM